MMVKAKYMHKDNLNTTIHRTWQVLISHQTTHSLLPEMECASVVKTTTVNANPMMLFVKRSSLKTSSRTGLILFYMKQFH